METIMKAPGEVRQQGGIARELIRQAEVLDRLEASFFKFVGKVEGVLRPGWEAVETASGVANPQPPQAPISNQLAVHNDRLWALLYKVDAASEGVDLE